MTKNSEAIFQFCNQQKPQDLTRKLEAAHCSVCCGTGFCDDADCNDISYRSWTCPACDGTGWDELALRQMTEENS